MPHFLFRRFPGQGWERVQSLGDNPAEAVSAEAALRQQHAEAEAAALAEAAKHRDADIRTVSAPSEDEALEGLHSA